jgi:hypothetical protein
MKKLLVILLVAIIGFTSCRTSGYGCKGRESWSQMVKRNNRPY